VPAGQAGRHPPVALDQVPAQTAYGVIETAEDRALFSYALQPPEIG
jgi:hypothetical protein